MEQSRLIFEAEGASEALIESQLAFLDDVIPLTISEDYEATSERTREVALEQLEIAHEEGDPLVAQIKDGECKGRLLCCPTIQNVSPVGC